MIEKGRNKKSNFIDIIFNYFKNNQKILLISIFLLGFILRFIVSSNLTHVEDEMVHGVHALGFSKLAPLSTMTQGPIWYYLTDYAYRIFGVSLLTARFLSFIFGSLSIIVVYMIATRLYNKKAGLIAAFLLAISAFHITWTSSYQDQTMMFFVLLASYFFIKSYQDKGKISILAAVFLAIAELVKIITGAFVIVFLIFMIWIMFKNYKSNKELFKNNLRRFILFIVILLIGLVPIIMYNIFLFKSKGIVDLPLAQFLRINPEFYTGPGLAHGEGFVLNKLVKNLYSILTVYFIKEDLLVFLIGLLGIFYCFKRLRKEDKKLEKLFFLGMFIFVLLFIASSIVLQTHYTSFFSLFALFGSHFIVQIVSKINKPLYQKYFIALLLIIILSYNLWHLHDPLTSRSATQQLRSYASQTEENTLILVDSRIYTGAYAWMFYDKHYINAQYVAELLKGNSSQFVPVKTIFIECVNDDCGWGTIKDQPELNESMELLISQFKEVSSIKSFEGGGSIKGVRGAEIRRVPFYRIYETRLSFNPQALNIIDNTHNHFFYHIPRNEYPELAFDYYSVNGAFSKLLNVLAYSILYILMILAIFSIIIPFYLLRKQNS
ncbi:MAG: glycosyltransferase family 39 protein [Nanoarchaeota archaeon]